MGNKHPLPRRGKLSLKGLRHPLRFLSHVGLNVKFTGFYALFVFLPTLIFLTWYSTELAQDRRAEYRMEKQEVLAQSLNIVESQLLLTESITMTLQSSTAVSKLLQNQYTSASDELFDYLSIIRPTLIGFSVFHPFLENLFIYRSTDSALSNADFVHYIRPVQSFPYGDDLLQRIQREKNLWHVAMSTEQDPAGGETVTQGPRLVCFSKLYDKTYSNVIGILELQISLDRICRTMNFLTANDRLSLIFQETTYVVMSGGDNHDLQALPKHASAHSVKEKPFDSVSLTLEKTNLEFQYEYEVGDLEVPSLQRVLPTSLLLLLPTSIFLLILYRFTGKMVRFSNHIKNTEGSKLSRFEERVDMDEFGIVVTEFNTMTGTINTLIRTVCQMEKQKNEANYYAMQSQIDPHFLFNTLENIRMQVDMKSYEVVGDMLFALSRLMRYNISLKRESTLLNELNHIRNYLFIYHNRQKNRIRFDIRVDKAFQDIACPFCILQPIVENSIKHGIQQAPDSICIDISLAKTATGVAVIVRDTGAGMSPERMKALNEALSNEKDIETNTRKSIGLANVNSRIKYFYGRQYGLSYAHNQPQGATCIVSLGLCPAAETMGLWGKEDG